MQRKTRSSKHGKRRATQVAEKTNRAFMRHPGSGGANNVMSRASIEALAAHLDGARKFTRRSVFVDFGCSAGALCLYIAQRYGCWCIGIEKEAEPLSVARSAATTAGWAVGRRVQFIEGDFTEPQFGPGWLERVGATHVFAYDKVFAPADWNALFGRIAAGPTGLVGASCAVKRGCRFPDALEKLGEPTEAARLCGGKSGYALQLWRVAPH